MPVIITAQEVATALDQSVNTSDVLSAIQTIESVTGLNIAGEKPETRFTRRDYRILRSAIVAQVQYLAEHPDVLTRPQNVLSASANGVAVSYGSGAESASDGILGPVAARYVATLGGAQQHHRTVHVAPPRKGTYYSFLTDEVIENGIRRMES